MVIELLKKTYTNMWGLLNRLVIRDRKKAYMVNQILEVGALNCFEELTSINWHLNVAISVIGLSLGAKNFFCDQ
jgi:hypothetical protein